MKKINYCFRGITCTAILVALATSNSAHAQSTPDAVTQSALGIALTTLPSGLSVAAPGEYMPGAIDLVTTDNHGDELRFAVAPLGTADTSDEIAAATTAANALVQDSNSPISVARTSILVAGVQGVMLQGLPGSGPNVQIVIAHGGVVYDLVAYGGLTLQPDALQVFASLHFVPRVGAFPSANPPAPQGKVDMRVIPHLSSLTSALSTTHRMSGVSRTAPRDIDSTIHMYPFWGSAVNAGCGSHGGALVTTCGGYFYNEGDHKGINDAGKSNNYYAIDWPLYAGNSIFPQRPSVTVKFAGWRAGGFMGFGNWVVLDNGSGVISYYAHMQDVSVSANQNVNWTTSVGHSGCTDNCQGAHAHVGWVQSPSFDAYGQPLGGTSEPQTPLYTFSSTPAYYVYTSLTAGETVNGW